MLAPLARITLMGMLAGIVAAAGCGDEPPGDADAAPVDTTAPLVGTAPVFSALAATSVTASWGAASDDVTEPAALQYKVVRASSAAAIDTLAEVDAITSAGAGLELAPTAALTVDIGGLAQATAYAFAVVVEDAAGNQALYTPALVTTLDGDDPTVTIAAPSANGTYTTVAATVALAGTASDDVAVTSIAWVNVANAASGAASGTTAWSVASVPLELGYNTITVTASDGAGNTTTATITVIRDNVPPTVTITAPSATGAYLTSADTIALAGTAADDLGVASVQWFNATTGASGTSSGTTAWSVASVGLDDEANAIVVIATDTAGNIAFATITVSLVGAIAVDGGVAHTCALLGDVIKCWGRSFEGQLGQGDMASRGDGPGEMGSALPAVALGTGRHPVAVSAGFDHTCALLDDGAVKCWGDNDWGQLGMGDTASRGDGPGEMGDALPAVALGAGRTAVAVAAGSWHNCALLDDATVKCWGFNGSGQLGLGDGNNRGDQAGEMGDALPTVALGTGRTAVALAGSSNHTCALLDNATVKCWGLSNAGQLGQGDTNHRGDGPGEMGDALPSVSLGAGRTTLAVTAGDSHSCALLDNATVKCWGRNLVGQLGQGDTNHRGDGPGEMGDALPPVSLGAGRTAVAVSAGAAHGCALLDNASLKCWGNGFAGALGQGDSANRGDGPGEMGDSLPAIVVDTGRTIVAVHSGVSHTCARLSGYVVKCWGSNDGGQLGLGDTANRGDGPGEMGASLPLVDL